MDGGDGNDEVVGNGGNDYMVGSTGDDKMDADDNANGDLVNGGAGSDDRCVVDSGDDYQGGGCETVVIP